MESEYTFRNIEKELLQHQCNDCRKTTAKQSYQKTKDRVKAAAHKRTRDLREQFAEYKKTLQCSYCDEKEPCCLEFHHTNPFEKDTEVSSLLSTTTSWTTLIKEISKCVVLCSNCHRKVHKGIIVL